MPFAGDLQLWQGPLLRRRGPATAPRFDRQPTLTAADREALSAAVLAAADGPNRELVPVAALDSVLVTLGLASEDATDLLHDIIAPWVAQRGLAVPGADVAESKSGEGQEGQEGEDPDADSDEEGKSDNRAEDTPNPPGDDDGEETKSDSGGESKHADGPKARRRAGPRISLAAAEDLLSEIWAPFYVYGKELNRAAARGDIEAARLLVARGCEPTERNGRGMGPLHFAAEAGNLEGIRHFCEVLGTESLESADGKGWTPLIMAASNGKTEAVELLLDLGPADCEARTHTGRTALHWACAKGRLPVCKTLLQRCPGPAVRARDGQGLTPLHLAVLAERKDIVDALLAAGADKEDEDESGRTPLDMCVDEDTREALFGR